MPPACASSRVRATAAARSSRMRTRSSPASCPARTSSAWTSFCRTAPKSTASWDRVLTGSPLERKPEDVAHLPPQLLDRDRLGEEGGGTHQTPLAPAGLVVERGEQDDRRVVQEHV